MFEIVLSFECFSADFTCECEVIFVWSFVNHQVVWFREPPLTIFANKFTFNRSHFSPVSTGVVFSLYLHNRKHLGGFCFCLSSSKNKNENRVFFVKEKKMLLLRCPNSSTSRFSISLLNKFNSYNFVWMSFNNIWISWRWSSFLSQIWISLSRMLIKTSGTLVCTCKVSLC